MIVLPLLFLFAIGGDHHCTLTEGIGNEVWKIGVTRKAPDGPSWSMKTRPSTVTLIYDAQGILNRIYALPGSDCQTRQGIKIGDSEERVRELYGKGTKSNPRFKGDPLGDFALEYKGVQFIITKRKVVAFCITPEAASEH